MKDDKKSSIIKEALTDYNTIKESAEANAKQKLAADEGYRIRAGDFRILYRIDDRAKEVIIYRVKHRREAYR